MKRIGLVASRAAKDDLVMYNVLVLALSFLLSLLIFLVSAFSLLAGIAIISYIMKGFMVMDAGSGFYRSSLACLTAVVGLVNLVAVLVNIKLKR